MPVAEALAGPWLFNRAMSLPGVVMGAFPMPLGPPTPKPPALPIPPTPAGGPPAPPGGPPPPRCAISGAAEIALAHSKVPIIILRIIAPTSCLSLGRRCKRATGGSGSEHYAKVIFARLGGRGRPHLHVQRDLGVQQAGHRAMRLGVLGELAQPALLELGHVGAQFEIGPGDAIAVVLLLDG